MRRNEERRAAARALAWVGLVALTVACDEPKATEHPTWADVRPILAGQCVHCHGSTNGENGGGFRFDFYDMTEETCGAAAKGLGINYPLAKAHAPRIINALTGDAGAGRPLMPPPPAPYIEDWQWQTLHRWWQDGVPKGNLPPSNQPATLALSQSAAVVDAAWQLRALVRDPDGDPVVGVINVAGLTLPMDRAGSFATTVDTSKWPPGVYAVTATLCDGWSKVDYTVSTLEVRHAP